MPERGFRVLVADDNDDDRELYKHHLKKIDIHGLNVKYASNHDDALKVAKSFKPHIIFTDYTLRDSKIEKGGLSLIYYLRNEDFNPLFYVCSSIPKKRLLKEIENFSEDEDLKKIYPEIKDKIRRYIFKENIEEENKDKVSFFKAFSIFVSAIPRVLFIDTKSALSRHKSEAKEILEEHDSVFEYESEVDDVFERVKHFHPHVIFMSYNMFEQLAKGPNKKEIRHKGEQKILSSFSELDYDIYNDKKLPYLYLIGGRGASGRFKRRKTQQGISNFIEQELNRSIKLNGFIDIHSGKKLREEKKKVKEYVEEEIKHLHETFEKEVGEDFLPK